MSNLVEAQEVRGPRFPRVSGDEPTIKHPGHEYSLFSPRERG